MLTLSNLTYEFPYLDGSSRALNMYRLGADVLGFAHRKIFSAKHLALSDLHVGVSVSHIVR